MRIEPLEHDGAVRAARTGRRLVCRDSLTQNSPTGRGQRCVPGQISVTRPFSMVKSISGTLTTTAVAGAVELFTFLKRGISTWSSWSPAPGPVVFEVYKSHWMRAVHDGDHHLFGQRVHGDVP